MDYFNALIGWWSFIVEQIKQLSFHIKRLTRRCPPSRTIFLHDQNFDKQSWNKCRFLLEQVRTILDVMISTPNIVLTPSVATLIHRFASFLQHSRYIYFAAVADAVCTVVVYNVALS